MKSLKKIVRICALILFMLLAVMGIGIFGVAPVLGKDRKLFADKESVIEQSEKNDREAAGQENLKF